MVYQIVEIGFFFFSFGLDLVLPLMCNAMNGFSSTLFFCLWLDTFS